MRITEKNKIAENTVVFKSGDDYLVADFDLLDEATRPEELSELLSDLYNAYESLYKCADSFYTSIYNAYRKYESICEKCDIAKISFDMPHSADNYALSSLSMDVSPVALLSAGISSDTKEDFIRAITYLITYYEDLFFYIKISIQDVIGTKENCLFRIVSSLAGNKESDIASVFRLIENMKEFTYTLKDNVSQQTGIHLSIDTTKLNIFYSIVKHAAESAVPDTDYIGADSLSTELSDVFEKLMAYCAYSYSEVNSFTSKIDSYKALKNKNDTDENTRKLRRELSSEFYKLYENVFLTYIKSGSSNCEPYIDLFLNFGLLDESLISEDKINDLTHLQSSFENNFPAKVYLLKDWLTEIYEGTRIPSKNEFNEEYIDYIRKKKKEMGLTPEAEKELLENAEFKVKFEINNLFKCNHRLLGGSPATFWPMLTSDDVDNSFHKSFLSPEKFNEALAEIVAIDYSAFYRESMYENREKGILKEAIVKEIYPEIILLPSIGTTGTMWQEISGKRINTPGRFVFPTFFNGDLSTVLVKTLGRYRWEFCKTEQGMAWNDVSVPSLTSIFSDYAQFYRKNHELTAEKKELLKNQLSRCRNSIREVFIMDYFMWIRYEATGAMRLDKVARRTLATYCPFEKSIREKLAHHPAFNDAYTKYNLDKAKKTKEISNRYTALNRKGIEFTEELLTTENFYLNM